MSKLLCKVMDTDSAFKLLKWPLTRPLIKKQISTTIQEVIKEIYVNCFVLWYIWY